MSVLLNVSIEVNRMVHRQVEGPILVMDRQLRRAFDGALGGDQER